MATSTVKPFDGSLPEYVDWLAGAVIAIVGLGLSIGGGVIMLVVDRQLLAEGIESGRINVLTVQRSLTEAESLALATDVLTWTGVGLVVTGLGLLVFAVGFVAARHRQHSRATDTGPATSPRTAAVFGAVATTVLSFIPFSSVLGGGLAAYLADRTSDRPVGVGALSGALAVIPALIVLASLGIGLFVGFSGIQAGGIGLISVGAIALTALVTVAYGAGLGALGGYLGNRFANRGPR